MVNNKIVAGPHCRCCTENLPLPEFPPLRVLHCCELLARLANLSLILVAESIFVCSCRFGYLFQVYVVVLACMAPWANTPLSSRLPTGAARCHPGWLSMSPINLNPLLICIIRLVFLCKCKDNNSAIVVLKCL
jgi:hypothetical protein